MDASDGSLALDTGPGHTRTEWEAAAAGVLRKAGRLADDAPDADVWAALTRTTLDGIAVTPLGTPDLVEGLATSGRPTRAGAWDVRTHLRVTEDDDLRAANTTLLADLEGGATSLFLDLAPSGDLAAVLRGVLLDVAPVTLDRPTTAESEGLADLLDGLDDPPAQTSNLSADPVTAEMLPHRTTDEDRGESLVRLARRAADLGVLGVVVDGTALHDRGAGDAQEVGWTVAVGVHYLRLLTEAGFSIDQAAALVEFRYAVTDEQFVSIAKLRAARRLWARVLEASGGGHVPQRQHAVTSRAMMTTRDPWVNMVRTTVAGLAAGTGGADALTVLPFDTALGRPDALGRRIARNVSALLIEEAHIAVVTDPAGGSYAVERLTDDLAVVAWAELGRIEADGGAGAAAARTGVQDRVKELARRRDDQVAKRTRPITGLSEFPDLHEVLPERSPDPGRPSVRRWGWQFEDLRAEPATTPVFLATMGTIASYTARATFAGNLFAAGGVDVVPAGPTEGVDQVLAAYRSDAGGQPVVCLAGHDRTYAAWGRDLVAALRSAGATWVIVAGRPADLGVDDSCAAGVDALAFLTRTREHL